MTTKNKARNVQEAETVSFEEMAKNKEETDFQHPPVFSESGEELKFDPKENILNESSIDELPNPKKQRWIEFIDDAQRKLLFPIESISGIFELTTEDILEMFDEEDLLEQPSFRYGLVVCFHDSFKISDESGLELFGVSYSLMKQLLAQQ